MTYKYAYKNGLEQLVNDGFSQKDWGQSDIINKTKKLTKQGSYTDK